MKLKFLAGEPEPIYPRTLHGIINSIRVTYMRTVGRLGLTLIRTDISQNKWILRTRQWGMNPVDQFPRTRCFPLTPPHLKRSRRGSIRPSTRTNDDSRGNRRDRVLSRCQDERCTFESGTFERTRPVVLVTSLASEWRSALRFLKLRTTRFRRTNERPRYFRTESIFRARHLFGRHKLLANLSPRHINMIVFCAPLEVSLRNLIFYLYKYLYVL